MAVDSDLRPGDPPADPASRLWWAVPAVGTLLLALFGMIFGGEPEKVDYGTSYDASGGGSRAAFLLFEELGYPVERSRRPTGGDVRWLLFPSQTTPKDAAALDDWVRRGGIALLALDEEAFADQLGMPVSVAGRRRIKVPGLTGFAPSPPVRGDAYTAEATDVSHVVAGPLEVMGPSGGRAWGRIGSGPIATIYTRGRGQIWLLNRPDVLANDNLRMEDNAVLACRLADAMLAERPGGRLAFDEYCHGLRDRPSVAELLFRPPVLGVTIQALVLTLFVLWHFSVRFGPLRAVPPPARRSKEEFLDAMAELLERNGNRSEAFRTVRDALRHKIETVFGLPTGTPVVEIVREVVRRRGMSPEPLSSILSAHEPPGGFLEALHQLESVAHECFSTRPRPR